MDSTFPKNKDFSCDIWAWISLMIFLPILSFSMLTRDIQKQYGAVSFGIFPAFSAIDSRGNPFDQHRLHGQLSAVIVSNQMPEDILVYVHKLSQATSRGKKYLKGLVLASQGEGRSDQWVEYLTLNEDEFKKISGWKNRLFKDGVILVDQNSVVRGVFDLEEKLERLNFEGAVKGIL